MTFETVMEILNSPLAITVAASICLWVLGRIYAKKPTWQKYEGTIIAAIRSAEKAIPDNSENKSVKRLDEALKYVIKVFEEREKRTVTAEEKAEITEGIQILHNSIEA